MDTNINRPLVFVGSSSEGIEIARAVQSQLEDVSEVELWNEGIFGLSSGTLEALVNALHTFDFAVLVLTPDDVTISRGVEQNSARDNILLEIGLFIGKLGRDRTFVLYSRDSNVKIPSDLAGVTLASFSKPSTNSKLESAVGPACTKIRNTIRDKGRMDELTRVTHTLNIQKGEIEHQKNRLDEQQDIINQLIKYSMSASIFDHLCGITLLKEYKYRSNKSTEREMYFLRDNGFIKPKAEAFLDFYDGLDGQNLVEKAVPTEIGWLCIKLRKNEIPSNMLEDKGNLRIDPSTL